MKKILIATVVFAAGLFVFFFVGPSFKQEGVLWGVNFSQKHAESLGLNWRESYTALLDDLGVKLVKPALHWDILEPERGNFQFEDADFQLEFAKEAGARVMPVIGMKTTRWPECHIPEWAKELPKEKQQEAILAMLEAVIERYKRNSAVAGWQVENEPFFPFGECPWADEDFLAQELDFVRSLDPERPVMITDSGEGSFWVAASRHGDIVGTTMYRKVWFRQLGVYVSYPFPPTFYSRKAWLIDLLFGKPVIGAELQAEPWGPRLLYDISTDEMAKTMNPEQFEKNVEFAKKSGLPVHYLWGAEWWYWMKEAQGDPSFWELARPLFR